MNREALRQYLTFYQDLGVKNIYKRRTAAAAAPAPALQKTADIVELPSLAPSGDTLARILADIGDCRRCRLCEQRSKIVFGSGDENARLVFVGEGPGADEDAQ